MVIKGLIDEDFVNYKKPSMTIEFPYCSFKCDKECGQQVCQNSALAQSPNIEIGVIQLVHRYLTNPITKAIVCQGLEPFDSFDDLFSIIHELRCNFMNNDDIVIYTGYKEEEIQNQIIQLSQFSNIIVKFGRYIPNRESKFDEILGVKLASDNQYAKFI